MQYTYFPRLDADAPSACPETFPPWRIRSAPPGLAWALIGFFVPALLRFSPFAGADRPRSFLRELVDALGILAAPAGLLRVGGFEDPADFLHQIFWKTRFGDERIAASTLDTFRDPGQR